MGFLDRFRKKKQQKDGVGKTYILKRKGAKGGFEKVMELTRMMSPEELYPQLVPGVYIIHEYSKGTSGFTAASAPFEVIGEEAPTDGAPTRRASPFAGLREWAQDMKVAQEDLKTAFEVLGPMAGYAKAGEGTKSVIEQLREAKQTQKDLDDLFPRATSGNAQQIPISGTIPAALAFAPTAVDQVLDTVEKRLRGWDLIPAEEERKHEEVIKLPKKPAVLQQEKIEEKTAEVELPEEDSTIHLPSKPEVQEEVTAATLEEENKKEKEKGGGKSKAKHGK